jgi:hypothetical protein
LDLEVSLAAHLLNALAVICFVLAMMIGFLVTGGMLLAWIF